MCGFIRKIMGKPRVKINSIKSFELVYTCGTYINGNVKYGVKKADNGGYNAYIKQNRKADDQRLSFSVDRCFVEKLRELLVNNKAGAWNGFNKADKRVCDGNGFSLSLVTDDGQILYAHGYMRWPKNFKAVKYGVIKLFEPFEDDE